MIALVTTITAMTAAAAPLLAEAYHQRWEHETGNAQLKTSLRGPGKVLRSKSPDMVRQEIYGYLLTHYALSALICRAATEAGIDPDRVKFKRTVRIVRRRAADPAAFPAEHQERILAAVMADITRTKHLNPERRHRTYPRVIKRARHNSYRVKRPGDHGTRHAARPRSSWSTWTCPHSQHDQPVLGGHCATSCSIAGRRKVSVSSARRAIHCCEPDRGRCTGAA